MKLEYWALILIGAGVVSKQWGAGAGLSELGAGVTSLAAAPLAGTGLGLSGLAGGITDIASSFGDIGRGFGEIFKSWQDFFGWFGVGGAKTGLPPPSTSGNSAIMMNSTATKTNGLTGIVTKVPTATGWSSLIEWV